MSLIIQYYSDDYVSSVDQIKRLAQHINDSLQPEDSLIIIIPGIEEMIADWLKLADQISSNPPLRDIVMLRDAANQVSIAVLTIALQELGRSAIALIPNQIGITPEDQETQQIPRIDRIERHLQEKTIVVISDCFNFIAIDQKSENEAKKLTRYGMDLARQLKINFCEIYTDEVRDFTNKYIIYLN